MNSLEKIEHSHGKKHGLTMCLTQKKLIPETNLFTFEKMR